MNKIHHFIWNGQLIGLFLDKCLPVNSVKNVIFLQKIIFQSRNRFNSIFLTWQSNTWGIYFSAKQIYLLQWSPKVLYILYIKIIPSSF